MSEAQALAKLDRLAHELACMTAGRDCTSTLAEAFGRGCSARCDQLIEAVGLMLGLAEALETAGVESAFIGQARSFANSCAVEEIRRYVTPKEILAFYAFTDPGHLGHVRDARRDPGHPLHALVNWVERSLEDAKP